MNSIASQEGRTLLEMALSLGIAGTLVVSLVSCLVYFFSAEARLRTSWVTGDVLETVVSFLEGTLRKSVMSGGSLVMAGPESLRVESKGQSGGKKYLELRFENGGITVKEKHSGPERTTRPVPGEIVVSLFSVTYLDSEGRSMEFPVEPSRVRCIRFRVRAYHRDDPARTFDSGAAVRVP